MALTPERINELKEQAVSAWRAAGFEPMLQVFVAHAIETEVRKSDEALILQLVEAMDGVKALNMGGELALWTAEFDRLLSAIAAARERLGGQYGTE